jgi:hypothetical protein
LAAYEVLLSKTKYLAGDSLTLADLFHLPYGTMLGSAGVDFLTDGTFPNVSRWAWAFGSLYGHCVLTDFFHSDGGTIFLAVMPGNRLLVEHERIL